MFTKNTSHVTILGSFLRVSIPLAVMMFSLNVPSASAAALCVTNPEYGLCAVSLSVTPISSSLSSGGSTNVTLKALGILQYDVFLTDFYAYMVEDSTGISTDLYYSAGPLYAVTRTANTGPLTKSVTVYLYGENTQGVTRTVSTRVNVTTPFCSWSQTSFDLSQKCGLPFTYLPSPLPACSMSNVNTVYFGCAGVVQHEAICECEGVAPPPPSACSGSTPCGSPGSCYAKSGCNNVCNSTATDYNGSVAGCGVPPPADCSGSTPCGSPGSCYAKSGCNNVCNSTATDYNGSVAGCGVPPPVAPTPASAPTVTWTKYCTGGSDINGNNWQIWAYSNPLSLSSQWIYVERGTYINGCSPTCANGGLSGPVDCPTSAVVAPVAPVAPVTPVAPVLPVAPVAPVTPSCSPRDGRACYSSRNSCGMRSSGTYDCDGYCDASTPSDPSITATISVTPNRVRAPGTVTVSWTTTGATSCTIKTNDGRTLKTLSNTSCVLTPVSLIDTAVTTQTTYIISCTGGAETASATSNIVNVVPYYEEF